MAAANAALAAALARCTGREGWRLAPLHASSFCDTWRAERSGTTLFLKTLPAAQAEVLAAEADGLSALAATRTVRVPAVVACSVEQGEALLALEWLDLAPARGNVGERFGRALAALHAVEITEARGRYGWRRDNRLGATLQRTPGAARVAWPAGSTSSAACAWLRCTLRSPRARAMRPCATPSMR